MNEHANPRETAAASASAIAGTAAEISSQYARVMRRLASAQVGNDEADSLKQLIELFAKGALHNMSDVHRMLGLQLTASRQFCELYSYAVRTMLGEKAEPPFAPDGADERFASEEWRENLWFSALMQSYLIGSQYLQGALEPSADMNEKDARKLSFFASQLIDAMAPTNFAWTNPDVIRKTQETKGANIARGMKQFADDLESGAGVSMVDKSAFELGKDIAATPGKVVARNRLAELIQYEPATKETHSVPVMIIPPWINKYYILDLKPKNSFIGWLVRQGYTVFVVSWINPDESYRDTTYDDYLELGPLWALDQIEQAVGSEQVNAIGYCLGGTLLATLLSYLTETGSDRVKSATFFTSMIDFGNPGDLGVFVDEDSVSRLEQMMEKDGYLDGSCMASTFSMMRANDLVWHFVINNYLLGESPGAFDLLYWNSDSTRMPARMHSEYLRSMYLENRLREPGGMNALGVPIDLSKVKTPCYFLSTESDHIAPWKSTYAGARLMSGGVRFVLGESGHIAGVVNPPEKKKYGYWTKSGKLPASPDGWLDGAVHRKGSWWPDWQKWSKRHSGAMIEAKPVGSGKLETLEDAPGSYVRL